MGSKNKVSCQFFLSIKRISFLSTWRRLFWLSKIEMLTLKTTREFFFTTNWLSPSGKRIIFPFHSTEKDTLDYLKLWPNKIHIIVSFKAKVNRSLNQYCRTTLCYTYNVNIIVGLMQHLRKSSISIGSIVCTEFAVSLLFFRWSRKFFLCLEQGLFFVGLLGGLVKALLKMLEEWDQQGVSLVHYRQVLGGF